MHITHIWIPQIVSSRVIIRQGECVEAISQVLAQATVNHRAELVTIKDGLGVCTGGVGMLRINNGCPFAVRVFYPGLIRGKVPQFRLVFCKNDNNQISIWRTHTLSSE